MPPQNYYDLVAKTRQKVREELSSDIETYGYGNLAEGNLHLKVCLPGYDNVALIDKAHNLVDTFVMGYTQEARGSVSAEHGVGLKNVGVLGCSKSPEMIGAMRMVKKAFDPKGIMNPYKVLPE